MFIIIIHCCVLLLVYIIIHCYVLLLVCIIIHWCVLLYIISWLDVWLCEEHLFANKQQIEQKILRTNVLLESGACQSITLRAKTGKLRQHTKNYFLISLMGGVYFGRKKFCFWKKVLLSSKKSPNQFLNLKNESNLQINLN